MIRFQALKIDFHEGGVDFWIKFMLLPISVRVTAEKVV